jgi:hypothetical protein
MRTPGLQRSCPVSVWPLDTGEQKTKRRFLACASGESARDPAHNLELRPETDEAMGNLPGQ